MSYTQDYTILDVETGEIKTKQFRSRKEREVAPIIEVATKLATCTKCGYFRDSKNYHISSKSGTADVTICDRCKKVHFANFSELRSYIFKKFRKRYTGRNKKIKELINRYN